MRLTFTFRQCKGDDSQSSFPVFGNNVLVKASELNTTDSNTASNKVITLNKNLEIANKNVL